MFVKDYVFVLTAMPNFMLEPEWALPVEPTTGSAMGDKLLKFYIIVLVWVLAVCAVRFSSDK